MAEAPGEKPEKEKVEKEEPQPEEKKIEKVISGSATKRKAPIFVRVRDTFFGDSDFSNVAGYVAYEVVLPAIRSLVVETAIQGVQRAVFGEASPRRRPGPGRDMHIDYSTRRAALQREPRRSMLPDQPPHPPPRGARSQRGYDVGVVQLVEKADADIALERLEDVIDRWGIATVADLYDLLGLQTSYVDNQWGWDTMLGANVRQNRHGWVLELPEPSPVKED